MVVDFVSYSDIVLFAVPKKKDKELQGEADAKAATKDAVMKCYKAGKDNKCPSKKGAGSKRGGAVQQLPLRRLEQALLIRVFLLLVCLCHLRVLLRLMYIQDPKL